MASPRRKPSSACVEHGGAPDDGYGVYDTKIYQFNYFSFLMIRNGYVIHSATGKYDDADLPAKPKFYGNTEYGRMNMKVVTVAGHRHVRVAAGVPAAPR